MGFLGELVKMGRATVEDFLQIVAGQEEDVGTAAEVHLVVGHRQTGGPGLAVALRLLLFKEIDNDGLAVGRGALLFLGVVLEVAADRALKEEGECTVVRGLDLLLPVLDEPVDLPLLVRDFLVHPVPVCRRRTGVADRLPQGFDLGLELQDLVADALDHGVEFRQLVVRN